MNPERLARLVALAGDAATEHAPFGARTTYRVGGTARLLLEVDTFDQLRTWTALLRELECRIVTLGKGSNLLVADGEFDGVVLVLGSYFEELRWHDGDRDLVVVEAGAALGLPVVARRLADAGVSGFEWAVGVPGSIGGAAVMNAGGHGSDMAHAVRRVTTWNIRHERLTEWSLEQLNYGYRSSALGPEELVMTVTLGLAHGDREVSREKIHEIVQWRRTHQPGGSNAGSVFRNPPHGYAGELIDAAGCKGRRHGSAHVSEKHANFIQVDDGGRASDVIALMREVRDIVLAHSGVTLDSELRTLGFEGNWP